MARMQTRATNPYDSDFSYAEDGSQYRRAREPEPEPVFEEEPFLGMVYNADFFEKIVGFSYRNLEQTMIIQTIPKYADNSPVIVIEEYRRETKLSLLSELTHLNEMYRRYMHETRIERQREIERARTREAEQMTQMVGRQLRSVNTDAAQMYPNVAGLPGVNMITPDRNNEARERIMDSVFGVRDYDGDSMGVEDVCTSEEEEPEEVEAPSLSFQTGSRFMNGNNCDE